MVEPILFFVLGFLAASLGALAFLRAVWGRAVRLTIQRLASRLPVSPEMIVADRDRLRAAHAIETRKLERRVEALGSESATYRATLARDRVEIRRLTADLLEAQTRLGAVEMREAAASEAVQRLTQQLAARGVRPLSGRGPGQESEAVRAEVASLRAEIAAMQAELEARRGSEAAATARLGELEGKNAELTSRLEQAQFGAAPAVGDGAEPSPQEQDLRRAVDEARAEKSALEVALEGVRVERTRLQKRVEELERMLAEGDSEDNQLLRNRLNALAADITRWTTGAAPPLAEPGPPAADGELFQPAPTQPLRSHG